MNVNNPLLRTYTKFLGTKKETNLEKVYQNNNYLVQIMKTTEKVRTEKPYKKCSKNLKNALNRLYKESRFFEDPSLNQIKLENDRFETDYKNVTKKFEMSKKFIFSDLINEYKKQNYKIPRFSPDHNIFKINPLLEQNTDKMSYFFSKEKIENVAKEKESNKIVLFLKKLNKLILALNNKNINQNFRSISVENKTLHYSQKKLKNNLKNETPKALKKQIKKLNELINDESLAEFDYKYSPKKSRFSTKLISSNVLKKFNLNKENNKNEITKAINDTFIKKRNRFSSCNITTKRISKNPNSFFAKKQISNISSESNKTKKSKAKSRIIFNEDNISQTKKTKNNHFNKLNSNPNIDYKNKENGRNINNFLLKRHLSRNYNENNNDLLLEDNGSDNISKTVRKPKFNLNFDKKNLYLSPKLPQNRLTKQIKNTPIFIKTQTAEKENNPYFLGRKKSDFKLKSRNISPFSPYSSIYSNRTDFVDYAYKKINHGDYNFEEIQEGIIKYLTEGKNMTEEESLAFIDKIKNKKNFLGELSKVITNCDLERKIEKLYLNNFMLKRIEPSLKNMKKREDLIMRLQNIYLNVENN